MQYESYVFPDSPFKTALEEGTLEIVSKFQDEEGEVPTLVENAFYCCVIKRMVKHAYEGDNQKYLSGLMQDISTAKREYVETNYHSDDALDLLKFMNLLVIGLLTEVA